MIALSWTSIELAAVGFAIGLIILLTVGGNLVVLFAFYNDPHLLTPSNHFLLSMAIADLLVGLIAMPFHSYGQLKRYWPFGDLFCKVWLTIDDVSTMASVLSIVAITIERYWSINHSVHYRRYTTKTRIKIFSILIWLIPLLNFAPGIWFLEPQAELKTINQTQTNHSECIGAYHSHTLYLIIAQINFFAWPLVVIIVLNALIVLNLYQRSHRFPSLSSSHDFRKNQTYNIARDSKEKKIDEPQAEIHEHQEQIVSAMKPSNSYTWKKTHIECNNDNHVGSIPAPIKEVDEPLIENDIVEPQPIAASSCEETDLKLSSTSSLYQRVKRALRSSSSSKGKASEKDQGRVSKCSQTLSEMSKRKRPQRSSIFAWRNSSVLLSPSMTSSNLTSGTGEHRNVRRLRRDKRAASSLLILVLVFMIFLLPYVVVVVAGRIFSLEILTDTDGQVYSAAFWLLWLNSTVNPILYPFIQPKFRDAYRKIFLRLIRRRRRLVSLMVDIQRDK